MPNTNSRWLTKISLRTLTTEEIAEIGNKCTDIHDVDDSFLFDIEDDVLIVKSETKEKAMKRGAWLVNKMDELKDLNWKVVRDEVVGEVG